MFSCLWGWFHRKRWFICNVFLKSWKFCDLIFKFTNFRWNMDGDLSKFHTELWILYYARIYPKKYTLSIIYTFYPLKLLHMLLHSWTPNIIIIFILVKTIIITIIIISIADVITIIIINVVFIAVIVKMFKERKKRNSIKRTNE